LVLAGTTSGAHAQETYDGAAWRFGVFGGMNFNIVGAGSQELQGIGTNFSAPHNNGVDDIIDGTGLGLYGGGLVEYNSGQTFGGHLRIGLDDRRVKFNDWDVPDASSTRFSARMTYVSVEPSLRVNLGSPDFHMLVGPLLSFKVSTKYDYVPGRDETSPAIADQEIPGTNDFTYGLSGGFGYDININSKSASSTRWYLTPFVEASYMMDQRDNTRDADRNDTWVTTSIRGGFQVKFGSGPAAVAPPPVVAATPDMNMQVRVPPSVVEARRVIEFFPLRNYIFFDENQTSIPAKYTTLSSADAATFSEEMMLDAPVTGTSESTTRSQRQMNVYYNALNVVGDRLRDNPSSTIRLVGSAPAKSDGMAMANSVKNYLVSTYGIDASRITVESQERAPHASGTRRTPTEDLDLVREENRRVEILSNDLAILKPVKLETTQQEPFDNDIVMMVNGNGPISNWTARISGEGFSRTYGPYSASVERVDAKEVLQNRASGNYTAEITMVGADGQTMVKSTNFQLVKKELPPVTGQRFSILFEFDESRTVQTYDQFLRAEVAPMIPANSTIVVHGHTDVVGETDYNYDLSTRRATETQKVLQEALQALGRSVTFDSYGFGEDESRAAFANGSPEGRYYNRTVMIEVIPAP
jgi:outer membrane protein OmpA-like peptidoglycan-associated protein